MNQLYKIIYVTLSVLLLAGCTKEDDSYCPNETDVSEYNVMLEYRLPDNKNECHFFEHITSVDLFIYDSDGKYIETVHTVDEEHREYKGARLNLKPGLYSVVAWANIADNTQIKGVHGEAHEYGPHISYSSIENNKAGTADPLFYAPYSGVTSKNPLRSEIPGSQQITVDKDGSYESVLDFTLAHRQVIVYILGYQDDEDSMPIVELTDLPIGLSFYGMNPLKDKYGNLRTIDSWEKCSETDKDGVTYAASGLQTFWFDPFKEEVDLTIVNPVNGKVEYTIPLKEAIGESTNLVAEVEIEIKIVFNQGGVVEVGVPDWGEVPSEPGFEW